MGSSPAQVFQEAINVFVSKPAEELSTGVAKLGREIEGLWNGGGSKSDNALEEAFIAKQAKDKKKETAAAIVTAQREGLATKEKEKEQAQAKRQDRPSFRRGRSSTLLTSPLGSVAANPNQTNKTLLGA